MQDFLTPFGGFFAAIAIFFLLGLLRPFARHFYPQMPSVRYRAIAPILFSCLAIACFRGAGFSAMLFVAGAGILLIFLRRANSRSARINVS